MNDSILSLQDRLNRRVFLRQAGGGIGLAAIANLLQNSARGGPRDALQGGAIPQVNAKAKRVIYLFQSGAPSQMRPRSWFAS